MTTYYGGGCSCAHWDIYRHPPITLYKFEETLIYVVIVLCFAALYNLFSVLYSLLSVCTHVCCVTLIDCVARHHNSTVCHNHDITLAMGRSHRAECTHAVLRVVVYVCGMCMAMYMLCVCVFVCLCVWRVWRVCACVCVRVLCLLCVCVCVYVVCVSLLSL